MGTRDFVGYDRNPPHPRWPGGARIAVNVALDVGYFAGVSEAYKEFFQGDSLPSRATVTGMFGIPELLAEFDVIANIDDPKLG